MNPRKSLTLLLAAALALPVAATAQDDSLQSVIDAGVLRVAAEPGTPPMLYKNGARYDGFDWMIARAIAKRIGVDATGARFNSIIAIEGVRTVIGSGAPEMNPLVNPGAISATSMVTGGSSDAVWKKIIGFHNDSAGRELKVLQDVYKSESDTNQRNQAIGALMLAYGYIKDNWQQAVDLYTRQCSIGVNAQDLATMAATLANGGKNPVTGKQVMKAENVPEVLAVMATAGLYDDSGKWLYATGLPAKSGVGGGILAVSPGKFGIAVISPPLDQAGNSVRAQKAIADVSNALGGNPYAPKPK